MDMKLIIIAKNNEIKKLVRYHLKPVGFEIFDFDSPLEVIDILDEISPEMILFHAGDFPREWKPLLKLLRETKKKEDAVFILLKPDNFPFEEAAKANHLGVNGIISANFKEKQQVHQLEELFRRYRSLKDQRRFHRLAPGPQDRLQLMFTHPHKLSIITGKLIEISIQGASFIPGDPSQTRDLKRGQELPLCSLRVGDDIISLLARVSRNKEEIGLQFYSFETGGHHKLFRYIQSHSERELKKAIAASK